MGSLTKASGVAVSMLVAATASVLLLLPGHPRMRTSRGAGMTPAVMVASATATPPGPSPVLSGAAHRCLPPVALTQHCRVSGDSTGGTRAATAGRRRCRHGPAGTGRPDPGRPRTGPSAGQDGTGQDGTGQDGTGQDGTSPSGTGQDGTSPSGTGQDGTSPSGTGQDGTSPSGTGQGTTGQGTIGQGGTGQANGGPGSWWRAGPPAAQRRPASQPRNCPTTIPRRPR